MPSRREGDAVVQKKETQKSCAHLRGRARTCQTWAVVGGTQGRGWEAEWHRIGLLAESTKEVQGAQGGRGGLRNEWWRGEGVQPIHALCRRAETGWRGGG